MPLSRTSSSSSTEPWENGTPGPGAELAGFRLERVIGRGPGTVVFEATQISLQRSVALKLFATEPPLDDKRAELRWPEHPQIVSLYAAGACDYGYFVAMQLVGGTSLARLLETRRPRRSAMARMLKDVGAALDAAHRSGIAHGAVGPRSILIDEAGRGYLSDFGARNATPESDRADFAALVRECLGRDVSDLSLPHEAGTRRRRRRAIGAGAVAVAAVAVAAFLAASAKDPESAPAALHGALAIGSALPASDIDSVDCSGRPPSGGSQPCVVVQTRLEGRPVAARAGGVVRRWTVRGASGQLALEVLRRRGARTFMVARTQYSRIGNEGVQVRRANLPVRAGDLIGLAVAPGSAIGVRRSPGAATERRFGSIDLTAELFDTGTGPDQEVLLRVEYVPGARWRPAGRLTGSAAARAPAGRKLDVVELQRDLVLAAVNVRGQIVVDLFATGRRIVRLPVPGASPSGRLAALHTLRFRFGRPLVGLVWRNPDGLVSRDYSVTRRSLMPID
jgi:hypothetical protein